MNALKNEVVPLSTATSKLGQPITTGQDPITMAFTPNGRTGYVTDLVADAVTPINLATSKPGPAIKVGQEPAAIADGQTAYVTDTGSGPNSPAS
jgi:hyaluronoglucosaminidase